MQQRAGLSVQRFQYRLELRYRVRLGRFDDGITPGRQRPHEILKLGLDDDNDGLAEGHAWTVSDWPVAYQGRRL